MGGGNTSFRVPKVGALIVVFLGLLSVASAARNGLVGGRKQHMVDLYRSITPKPGPNGKRPVTDVNGNIIADYDVIYTFDQLIDHSNPSAGTFKQRYYHTWEYYKTGGPIVLTTPGEQTADDTFALLTNASMSGFIAQATNGAVINLEHRFYGKSMPFADMSVKSLQVHTVEQAIEDLVYFAQNVQLAMPGGKTDAVRPHKIPWILLGGSYSGALTSWTLNQKPGVFWAGYSSSGVIQPQLDFWQYFKPIQKNMPANCSADVQAAIEVVDSVIDSGNATAYAELLALFGFAPDLAPSNFANSLTYPVSDWQILDVYSDRGSVFFDFCDALEVQAGQPAPASGFGAQTAITAWGRYYRTSYVDDVCKGFDPEECMSFDGSTSSSIKPTDDRSWMWQVCNQLGWAQVGPPADVKGVVSKHFTVDNYTTYCNTAFDGAFTDTFESRVEATAKKYLGWGTKADRLFVVNGERDPWLEVTHSAEEARIASTSTTPIFLTDGYHCSDLTALNTVSKSIADVYQSARTTFPAWMKDFKASDKPVATTTGGTSSKGKNAAGRAHASSFAAVILAGAAFVLSGL
ncbi:hypothetical protein D9611_010202 [Ephemerocybe angulata]|uniref:Peptidase S28 n=1 Tax=Ephemerocybe angulata TaxID=980116 RepID=A0A8H5AZ31_9AGAR|nr:hypothetical protein D9611_010202 [Tulosesus angulatus]